MTPPPNLPLKDALAEEVALLGEVKSGARRCAWRLWAASEQSLAAPRAMEAKLTPGLAATAARGWPCQFRVTGGDVTPQGPGVLSMATLFVAGQEGTNPIESAYRQICAPIAQALAAFGIESETGAVDGSYCDGLFNVVVDGLKFAGTAQRMSPMGEGRWAVLGQAMMILEGDDHSVTDAINAFYRDAGLEKVVRSGVTVTLAELGIAEDAFVSALSAALGQDEEPEPDRQDR
ncbi:MAG: lipoate--protein ligase family protein [Pseudomonadota bacterium]